MNNSKQKKMGRPRNSSRYTTGGWWDCEIKVLCSMISDNQSISYIAEVLDRRTESVQMKIKILKRKLIQKAA